MLRLTSVLLFGMHLDWSGFGEVYTQATLANLLPEMALHLPNTMVSPHSKILFYLITLKVKRSF